MNFIDKRTVSVLFTIVVFALLAAMIYEARRPLAAFVFAILFAYLLNPLITRLQTFLRGSRGLAVASAYILLGAAITAFGITVGPRAFGQAERLGRELPVLMENVGSGEIAQQFGSRHGWDYKTQIEVQRFLIEHRDFLTQSAQMVANKAADLAGNLTWLLLIPILAIFLLKDHSHFAAAFLGLIESSQERSFLKALLNDLDVMLATFIRAQLSIAAIALVTYTSFLLAAQFPYAFAFGAIAGVLEFIPFVGPIITIVSILGVAFLTGYPHWPIVIVFLILWRLSEDYVISPYLMRRGLQLHPLAVIFGVLVGGEIGGMMGLFLSVPIIAGLRIIWRAWSVSRQEKELPSTREA